MKTFIVLCAVLALAFADWTAPSKEQQLKYKEECRQELQLTEADTKDIETKEFLDDNAMCFVRCASMKMGIWDDAEGFNVNRFYETVKASGHEAKKEDFSSCFHRVMDVSSCQWAQINMKCVSDRNYVTEKTQE